MNYMIQFQAGHKAENLITCNKERFKFETMEKNGIKHIPGPMARTVLEPADICQIENISFKTQLL